MGVTGLKDTKKKKEKKNLIESTNLGSWEFTETKQNTREHSQY